MIDLTPAVRPLLVHRAKISNEAATNSQVAQLRELQYLLEKGRKTQYGVEIGLDRVHSYEDYKRLVPIRDYEYFRPWVMRMIAGERDILWPGVTRRYAQSSGTSGGKSKYIPITDDALKSNHYQGATDVVAHYLRLYPSSRIFSGKAFILGGSFANELSLPPKVRVGDLSANLIDNINPLANLYRVPSKKIALIEDWREKLPALIEASYRCDITNLSGVPSWFLTVLKGVIAKAGASTIHDVWPNLEVFFHGGIAFGPYSREYRSITAPGRMHYIETYNASEGFFAVQTAIDDTAMMLLANIGIFYEFIPIEHADDENYDTLPLWQVEPGKTYAMVISARNGLWRYKLGDTVKVESIDPVKITIAGRTQTYINAFGEEVMVYNTDAALVRACEAFACSATNYTAAPVYTHGNSKGRHQWLIEWDTPPADLVAFARHLDKCLQDENSDYQAKRTGGIFLDCLEVISARPGLFDRWLSTTGKLGGQRKIPRLSNDRHIIDSMLAMQ